MYHNFFIRSSVDGPYSQDKNRDADIENRLWTQQGKEKVGQIERVALMYVDYHV